MEETNLASPMSAAMSSPTTDLPRRRWGKHRAEPSRVGDGDQHLLESGNGYPSAIDDLSGNLDSQGVAAKESKVAPRLALLSVAIPAPRAKLLLKDGAVHVQGLFADMNSSGSAIYEQLLIELKHREKAEAQSRGAYWRAGTTWEPGVTRVRRSDYLVAYPVHAEVIRRMSMCFGVQVEGWWVNHYAVGSAEKRMHRDGWGRQRGVNITVGASFGATRTLRFERAESASRANNESREVVDCPQADGDVLAFGEVVNRRFRHGVPSEPGAGPRISVIIMGHAPSGWESKCLREHLHDKSMGA
eukprot:gnl/MRDRNA2_/MRDRNA2_27809_c0_seq2.p1 gnl/MRDRNA2_/MRDRNA2_27809_c0~~gnl/MRDRNA2_/MRDRNA2_27809_c0_seq2.p1  ORF type:complete len:301 (+),score=51.38 gnl/MRDRNA2_/MRDRNA2_27809_c0_seq2:104-1006(+)